MEPKIWDFWSNVLLLLLSFSSSKSTESSICCQRRRKTISVVCKCVLRIVWLTKTDFPVQQEGRESLCYSSDDLFVQRPSSKCTTHKSIKIFIEQFLKILYVVVCVFASNANYALNISKERDQKYAVIKNQHHSVCWWKVGNMHAQWLLCHKFTLFLFFLWSVGRSAIINERKTPSNVRCACVHLHRLDSSAVPIPASLIL